MLGEVVAVKTLDLIVETKIQKRQAFEVREVILAGYTGRDQEAVSRHIEELKKHGIPAPEETPAFYPVTADRITSHSGIEVLGEETSGEAEFVLLCDGEAVYVAVGSDHTDRGSEKVSVAKSKQLCPKPISPKVWPLEDVRDRWDDLVLRSWVWREGSKTLYQDAMLASLMTPEDLIDRVKNLPGDDLAGKVIYSGTVPLLSSELIFSEYFEVQLIDQARDWTLKCAYFVKPITWLNG